MSNNDGDETRRRQEINLFAAMALGASDDGPLNSATFAAEELSTELTINGATGSIRIDNNAFGAAASAAVDTSGTFHLSAPSAKRAVSERSNLEAAAAALSDDQKGSTPGPALTNPLKQHAPPQFPVEEENVPMFVEEVIMPRPLFFGAVVPPRVLEEGRQMIKQAMRDLGLDEHFDQPPSLAELPEGVRNLVGALRTHGFGLDDLLFKPNSVDGVAFGNPNVSTFQPVWGESIRAERIREHRKRNKPTHVSRASTAPPRLQTEGTPPVANVLVTHPQGEVPGATAGESVASTATATTVSNPVVETPVGTTRQAQNDQFSSWLRAEDDSLGQRSAGSQGSAKSLDDGIFLSNPNEGAVKEAQSAPMSEQELFSQWARGIDSVRAPKQGVADMRYNQATFQKLPPLPNASGDGDDDSLHCDELKKQVGMNDHLSKAAASLADDGQPPLEVLPDDAQVLVTQALANDSRTRPLTNYELTNGCVPLFGVDDTPLPVEGDLGVHETKEEQQRSNEQKRSEEIIEKFVGPNIFGSIACPNPALNPDDFHSWNSRTMPSQRSGVNNNTLLPDQLSVPPLHKRHAAGSDHSSNTSANPTLARAPSSDPVKPGLPRMSKRSSRSRYGWWNVEDKAKDGKTETVIPDTKVEADETKPKTEAKVTDRPLQLPPLQHSSSMLQVATLLDPTPTDLYEANLPLSRMHAATSMAQALPYLSDRPPSFRYVQIDTQAVAFRPLGSEIEPLFCSLAIYNVETLSSSPGDHNVAPVPDLQRCGRVTEALRFDVVNDPDVAKRCSHSLWPYVEETQLDTDDKRLQGTRCGVFPVPSNLSVSNLYAVLIVRKALAYEGPDLEPYLKPGYIPMDMERLRARAEKSSGRLGQFLVPFAFAVAPLLQVFGTENPTVASSRAVQIPLFRFLGGETNIIDHIMVMLHPRADHRASGIGGPAAVTNGGTAMLVMRNFGYLGLHAVVDKKSNLARDRLVDFTGELQIRLMDEGEEGDRVNKESAPQSFSTKLPEWHHRFVAEPSINGGRNRIAEAVSEERGARSMLYAQELAPLPLQLAPSSPRVSTAPTKPGMPRGKLHGDDIEPFYHVSFCNELLFHPRLLHNCPKGNIVIQVELRELEWKNEFTGYLAHLPRSGPSVHNPRRGPFLVQGAFTSCSPRGSDHQFIDEFKLKLPLDLKPRLRDGSSSDLVLFFTVFDVRVQSKNTGKTTKKLLGSVSAEQEKPSDQDVSSGPRMDQIACGFLPLTNSSSLIENGLHDVRVVYNSRSPPQEFVDRGILDPTTLIVIEKELGESQHTSTHGDSIADESVSIDSRSDKGEGQAKGDGSIAAFSGLVIIADASESQSRGVRTNAGSTNEPISLQVRIVVHSSLHSQNETLTSYLRKEPDHPRLVHLPGRPFMSKVKMGRDFLTSYDFRTTNDAQVQSNVTLELVVDIAKHQLCNVPQSSSHLWRITSSLWRQMICGTGEPDLVWANPSSTLPLRVHAFATMIHLVGSSAIYLAKNGVTLLDGVGGWNVVTIGRVLALLFDERKLFGTQALELVDADALLQKDLHEATSQSSSPSEKKRRHVRQTYDLSHIPPQEDVGGFDYVSPQAAAHHSPVVSPKSHHVKKLDDLDLSTKAPWLEEEALAKEIHPEATPKMKVDSKSDFQSALRAAVAQEDSDGFAENTGTRTAKAMIQAFGGMSSSGSRRWMTAPGRALSTIRETDDTDGIDLVEEGEEEKEGIVNLASTSTRDDDDGIVIRRMKKSVKQMRVPNRGKDRSTIAGDFPSVPKTDDEIETAGAAFLDTIGKSLGLSSFRPLGEESRVGSSHHRKTHSRGTSIDWSLRSESTQSIAPPATTKSKSKPADADESMSTLAKEESFAIELPTFVDRLALIGKKSENGSRWFPYAYEVIIMQWCAILASQRRLTEKAASRASEGLDLPLGENEALAHAAMRSIGVAIASAPMLFEVIKQSLGFRILGVFRLTTVKTTSSHSSPPLAKLDETLLRNLEQVISMVTDACLDSRNFDSKELRQMSIDVNDSVIRFLRDMFSFLAPSSVHRLVLVYFSRFVTKEGKQWQDRDSGIGYRCSWEITKIRINAVTALVRFPDFVKVNAPQMLNWAGWTMAPPASSSFFDEVLVQYQSFRMTELVGGDEVERKVDITIPSMKPHWLAEIVVDVCLLGTVHAEPYIQNRSASVLHELFWAMSQYGVLKGKSAPVSCMLVTYVEKLLHHVSYLSNFAAKSQLRKDLLPCAIYVLQSTPGNLLRAFWRRLCLGLSGKAFHSEITTGDISKVDLSQADILKPHLESEGCDVLDLFSLLNLSLKTIEYEGSEENLDPDSASDSKENINSWRKEFLLSLRKDQAYERKDKRRGQEKDTLSPETESYTSSISRKWQAHDGSLVVINSAHQVVLEMYSILSSSANGRSLLNPSVRSNRAVLRPNVQVVQQGKAQGSPSFTYGDVLVFVRGATSVYLQSLALRQSDIVIVRTFRAAAEAIKIFGIKLFLEALGETVQHWMRVIFFNCGARRAHVRVEATDLLELVLRSTWECYGSFFRIRVPLLAVQTEVMERIVATSAARYYRDQRRQVTAFETFSNLNAEASLVPLWRTLDRIEKQPASQNIAFRGALIRMAEKLKKLYRAYIAARVLSFIQTRSDENENPAETDHETEAFVRARRISVLRAINASEGYSKQFLGFQGTTRQRSNVAHYEAVEDALIDAADVFSPTELPEHRVAWLRMLADVHRRRRKFAEEATSRFYIHTTLQQASLLHGSLWSNTPFLPWTDNMPDPVYADPDFDPDLDLDATDGLGRQFENANSFRRIFYRVANSVGMPSEDWEGGTTKTLFCGVTYPFEYYTVSPWISLREMEENMVEEAEAAAELFLKAGIVQSSRCAWNLATVYYAEKFNYVRLAIAYGNLARTVVTQVPPIDTSLPQEVSATLGRFYRVWFHGGAPDELSGVEFVYRADAAVRLDQFGEELRGVIKSIIPEKTPIHLLLDGRAEERQDEGSTNYGFSRIGPAPLEPVRIKVTPLRPLSRSSSSTRGRPEWFIRYVDEAFAGGKRHRSKSELGNRGGNRRGGSSQLELSSDAHHRDHARSFSATAFSSGGSAGMLVSNRRGQLARFNNADRVTRTAPGGESELSGVDKFCFVQPKDRKRSTKEWWKSQSGDFSEKTLKVTQLQVSQSFPGCVTRQEVIHRLVYTQSPLEAGVDSICQWCAVLFRTAVATLGQTVLGDNTDPGIGTDAAKVVADSIHSSNVKEMGAALLKSSSDVTEHDSSTDLSLDFDRLTEDEIKKLRLKIARLLVVFIELLHLLISRNRDMLLDVIQERKNRAAGADTAQPHPGAGHGYSRSLSGVGDARPLTTVHQLGGHGRETPPAASLRDGRGRDTPPSASDPTRFGTMDSFQRRVRSTSETSAGYRNVTYNTAILANLAHRRARSNDDQGSAASNGNKTDSAIAVQSELQRAFINLCKTLYPRIQSVMGDDCPRWLKSCTMDNYFSLSNYRMTKIPIAEELCFNSTETLQTETGGTYMAIITSRVPSEIDSPRSIGGGSNHSGGVSKASDRFGSRGSDRFSLTGT